MNKGVLCETTFLSNTISKVQDNFTLDLLKTQFSD